MDIILTDISTGVRTRLFVRNFCAFFAFASIIEPKNHLEVLSGTNWINAMQDELNQFERNQAWTLIT